MSNLELTMRMALYVVLSLWVGGTLGLLHRIAKALERKTPDA